MLYCPFAGILYNTYLLREPKSYVRLLHASPDAPAVDVYANGNLIANNISYKSFTPYISVVPGNYNIRVFPTGSTVNPVIDTNLTIPGQSIFTVAAIGRLNNIALQPIAEPILSRDPGKVYIRFAHLSPDTPNVDITLPNGTVLFPNVGYKGVTNYIPVDPGTYTLEARPTGTNTVALYVPNITLKPNRFYTVYAVGLSQGSPSLQVLIPLDGNSYIQL